MAAIHTEEFFHCLALAGDVLVTDVDGVDDDDNIDGSLAAVDSGEGGHGLGSSVIQNSEVLLPKAADGLTGLGSNDHV